MSDSSNQQPIPNKVVEVLVDSIFRKNGIQPEEVKRNLSDEQKQKIRDMVEELKVQVENFNKNNKEEERD